MVLANSWSRSTGIGGRRLRRHARRCRGRAAPSSTFLACGIRVVEERVEAARIPDLLDAGDFAGLGGGEDVAGPVLLRGIGRRHEKDLADLFAAGNQHQRAAGLGDGGEVEEIVLLAVGPIHVAGVIARLGGIENQNALVADLLHDGLAAGGQVGHAVALPGSRRRWRHLPDARRRRREPGARPRSTPMRQEKGCGENPWRPSSDVSSL